MIWSDTAASIVNTMTTATADDRAKTARMYLGRTPVGAWEATFDSRQDSAGGTELICHSTATTANGQRPTIVVRVGRDVGQLQPGQRVSITGKLTELSVDDAGNPGGLLVLDNGNVSW